MRTGRLRLGVLAGSWPDRLEDHAELHHGEDALMHLDSLDAVLATGEEELLGTVAPLLTDPIAPLFVFVAPELPRRPLQIAEYLSGHDRVVVLTPHPAAHRLFGLLMPDAPCALQRPAVDTRVFRPGDGARPYDVILSGDGDERDPFLGRVHAIVRAQAARRGWSVLELTPQDERAGSAHDYAAQLASAKLMLLGTVQDNAGGRLVLQYVDVSMDRAGWHGRDEFYGYELPEVVVRDFEHADAPPTRLLESIATKTLALGARPPAHAWLRGLMVELSPELSDEQIADVIDEWIHDDEARGRLCERAYSLLVRGASSADVTTELLEVLRAHC